MLLLSFGGVFFAVWENGIQFILMEMRRRRKERKAAYCIECIEN